MALIINGERVDDAAIRREAERLRPHYEEVFAEQAPAEREAQLHDWSRENVIERVLIDQASREHGEEIPPDEIDSVLAKLKEMYKDTRQLYKDFGSESDEGVRRDIELTMRVERKLAQIGHDMPEPSQADIREYYEKNREQLKSAEQVRVAHIVKYVNWQTDEQTAHDAITAAYEKVKNGTPFETVVDECTDCSDSGGDIGYVTRGRLVEEFEDVVFNLGAGQVSDVFRTRFGFHVAKVYDRRPGVIPSLEEAKGQIKTTLKEQMREEAINAYIDGLKSKADIKEA